MSVENEIAADTTDTAFAATGQHCLPYVEPSLLEPMSFLLHHHEGTRQSATERYIDQQDVQTGRPSGLAIVVPLHQNVKGLVAHAMVPRLGMYATDDKSECCLPVRSRERDPLNQLTSTSPRAHEAAYGLCLDCHNTFMLVRPILMTFSLFRSVVATLMTWHRLSLSVLHRT